MEHIVAYQPLTIKSIMDKWIKVSNKEGIFYGLWGAVGSVSVQL